MNFSRISDGDAALRCEGPARHDVRRVVREQLRVVHARAGPEHDLQAERERARVEIP